MPNIPIKNRPTGVNYGGQQRRQRRRLLQVNAAVSPRDVLDPARLRRRLDFWPQRTIDRNNNLNQAADVGSGDRKRSYVGALIYKVDGCGELAVHVFDGYRVKISRRTESESKIAERICSEKEESKLVSNVYVVQKFVPVNYSTKTNFELDVDGAFRQRHRVMLDFQRKFVTKLEWSVEPGLENRAKCYHSEAYLNVL